MIDGCQAEYVRFHTRTSNAQDSPNLTEEDVLWGDISTGYFGAENADIKPGDTVAVMG